MSPAGKKTDKRRAGKKLKSATQQATARKSAKSSKKATLSNSAAKSPQALRSGKKSASKGTKKVGKSSASQSDARKSKVSKLAATTAAKSASNKAKAKDKDKDKDKDKAKAKDSAKARREATHAQKSAKKTVTAATKSAKSTQSAKKNTPKKTARAPSKKSAKSTASAPSQAHSAKNHSNSASLAKNNSKKSAQKVAEHTFFAPLSEGEHAECLRILTGDPRLASMAKVGRYRVIAVEPVATKPPSSLAGCRLARVVIYDYASDRSVEASVNLDKRAVAYLHISRSQPMLAVAEERAAIAIASTDSNVERQLSAGDKAVSAMHYWSNHESEISHTRRSAAVIFGKTGEHPSLVVVVDLLSAEVADIIPAANW